MAAAGAAAGRSCAADAFRAALAGIFSGPDKVRQAAVETAVKLGVKEVGPVLAETAADAKRPARSRVEALRALGGAEGFAPGRGREGGAGRRRAVGAGGGPAAAGADASPAEALPLLAKAVESGEIVERQEAYAVLGDLKTPGVDELLANQMDKLLEKKLAPEVDAGPAGGGGQATGEGREGPAGAATSRRGRRTTRWRRTARPSSAATPRTAGASSSTNPRRRVCVATRSTARAARSARS